MRHNLTRHEYIRVAASCYVVMTGQLLLHAFDCRVCLAGPADWQAAGTEYLVHVQQKSLAGIRAGSLGLSQVAHGEIELCAMGMAGCTCLMQQKGSSWQVGICSLFSKV